MTKNQEILKKDLAQAMRVRNLVLAYLKRARDAGIPEKYLRINKETFENILSKDYHKNIKDISNYVYEDIEKIVKTPYILIDGGNPEVRNMAGYAILFRIITCGKYGYHLTCNNVLHRLSTGFISEDSNRNELAEQLRDFDVLFISEFDQSLFKPQAQIGIFFDDIFSHRADNLKPTIVSFSKALSKNNIIFDDRCGFYFQKMSIKEYSTSSLDENNNYNAGSKTNPANETLRVRVRVI